MRRRRFRQGGLVNWTLGNLVVRQGARLVVWRWLGTFISRSSKGLLLSEGLGGMQVQIRGSWVMS